ncbi:VOC family protein [Amorphus sp. 3PC139-8]|uniref:VOC family protein n=1 Tax=Amorphus sp. 3PC139-8 TaxID=2735676 RepID=UPI00345DB406
MSDTNIIILYVTDVEASVRFYARVLELEALEASPGFALFALPSGLKLGLWRSDAVTPPAEHGGVGSEIGFQVAEAGHIDAICQAWTAKGVGIAFPPTDLGFGRSFMVHDPDGHRLRVYARANGA